VSLGPVRLLAALCSVRMGSRAGLKALYSDALKRAAVAAGIGAYLYTALAPVVLPIGPRDRQVQLIRRSGKADTLALSLGTEQWLRNGYEQRVGTEAVRRDLGEILAHGEPERGMGQGEATEQPAEASGADPLRATGEPDRNGGAEPSDHSHGNGVVVVDFSGPGPEAHDDVQIDWRVTRDRLARRRA